MFDPELGLYVLPESTFYFLLAMALFGVLMISVAFVVAMANMWQRHSMRNEMRAYVNAAEQLQIEQRFNEIAENSYSITVGEFER